MPLLLAASYLMLETKISSNILEAAALLANQQLVAIPTETVYGLAGNACSSKAIKQIFEVKQRPATNPLIVHVSCVEDILPYVKYIPPTAKDLLKQFSPGPITVLLPGNGKLPSLVNNNRKVTAFRIPAHSTSLSLLQQLAFPIVAPSANIYTTISPTTPQHVLKNFDGKIPMILDGGSCRVGIESTVVGFSEDETPIIYREGSITAEQIKSVVGRVQDKFEGKQEQLAPGMMPHHYSPKTPMILVDDIHLHLSEYHNITEVGTLCYNRFVKLIPKPHQVVLSAESNIYECAKNLYKALHSLDEMGVKLIVAEKLPNIGVGKAINDRLAKASYPFAKHNQHTNYPHARSSHSSLP